MTLSACERPKRTQPKFTASDIHRMTLRNQSNSRILLRIIRPLLLISCEASYNICRMQCKSSIYMNTTLFFFYHVNSTHLCTHQSDEDAHAYKSPRLERRWFVVCAINSCEEAQIGLLFRHRISPSSVNLFFARITFCFWIRVCCLESAIKTTRPVTLR